MADSTSSKDTPRSALRRIFLSVLQFTGFMLGILHPCALWPRDAHGNPDVIKSTTAPASDVVLEPRDLHPDRDTRDREVFDEISFDFDRTNSKDRRTIESNSGMELDLTDLGLDISEHDFLNFETSWLPNPAQEFTNPSSHEDQPENSGMLIDEVWHEIENQPNWPGIN